MLKKSFAIISLLLLITLESRSSIALTKTIDSLEAQLQVISTTIDSLTNLDEASEKENIQKVILLNNLSMEYSEIAPLQSKIYANRALRLSEQFRYKEGIGAAYYNLQLLYRNLGEYTKTLGYLYKNLDIKKELLKAARYRDEPVEVWTITQEIAESYQEIATLIEDYGNYSEAQNFLFRSRSANVELLELIEQTENGVSPEVKRLTMIRAKQAYISCTHSIGSIYLKKSAVLRENGDTTKAKVAYTTAARIFSESLEISNEIEDKDAIVRSYYFFGLLNFHLGNMAREKGQAKQAMIEYSIAIDNYFTCLNIIGESLNNDVVMNIYLNIGQAYSALNQITEAITYIKKGLVIAKESGHNSNMKIAYRALADLNTKIGDYKMVNNYNLLYSAIDINIAAEDMELALNRLETKHVFEEDEKNRKEKTVAEEIERNNRTDRYRFLGETAALIFIILFFAFVFIFTRAIIPYNISHALLFFTTLLIYFLIMNFIGPQVDILTDKKPTYKLAIYSTVAILMIPLYLLFKSKIVRA